MDRQRVPQPARCRSRAFTPARSTSSSRAAARARRLTATARGRRRLLAAARDRYTVIPRWALVGFELLLAAIALARAAARCGSPAMEPARAARAWSQGSRAFRSPPRPRSSPNVRSRWIPSTSRSSRSRRRSPVPRSRSPACSASSRRVVARRFAWIGARRYLAAAIALVAGIGIALLAVGAAELAWIWLVPAAALALAPRLPRPIAALAAATSLLPVVLVLHPRPDPRSPLEHGSGRPGVPLAASGRSARCSRDRHRGLVAAITPGARPAGDTRSRRGVRSLAVIAGDRCFHTLTA